MTTVGRCEEKMFCDFVFCFCFFCRIGNWTVTKNEWENPSFIFAKKQRMYNIPIECNHFGSLLHQICISICVCVWVSHRIEHYLKRIECVILCICRESNVHHEWLWCINVQMRYYSLHVSADMNIFSVRSVCVSVWFACIFNWFCHTNSHTITIEQLIRLRMQNG